MSDREIKNARISYTRLEIEDHGILTFAIGLDFGGSGQSFGGYALDGGKPRSYVSCRWLRELFEALEVRSWAELQNLPVRADASWGRVYRIGHLLKDKWFDPERCFKAEVQS